MGNVDSAETEVQQPEAAEDGAPRSKKPRTLNLECIATAPRAMSLEAPGTPKSAPPPLSPLVRPTPPSHPPPPSPTPPSVPPPPSPEGGSKKRTAPFALRELLPPISFSTPPQSPTQTKRAESPTLLMKDLTVASPAKPPATKSARHRVAQIHEVEGDHQHVKRRFSSLVRVYKVEKHVLGRGHYGVVRRGRHREKGYEVAIKSIPKHKIKNMDAVRREIQILQGLDHPNIIKYYETFEDRRYIHIVMELCSGGELFDLITDPNQKMTEHRIKKLVRKILEAVQFCHKNRIVHRDLKPENFLLTVKDLEKAELKVIDFGLSITFDKPDVEMTARVGTAYYIAPEVLRRRYTKSCDMWSAGVVMYILLVGYPPFYGSSDAEVMSKVVKGKYSLEGKEWERVSESAKDLIRHLLDMDPSRRYTATQALAHEWFQAKASVQDHKIISDAVYARMREYRHHHILKRVVLNVIAKNVKHEEIGMLKDTFVRADAQNRGYLTLEEVDVALRKSGHHATAHDIQTLVDALDINHRGVISYHEFLAASMQKQLYLQEERIFWAFSRLDHEGSGFITRKDLEIVIQEHHWNTVSVLDLLEGVDLNHDGKIDYYEFLTMMRGMEGDPECQQAAEELCAGLNGLPGDGMDAPPGAGDPVEPVIDVTDAQLFAAAAAGAAAAAEGQPGDAAEAQPSGRGGEGDTEAGRQSPPPKETMSLEEEGA